jgi:hypothetical protein
VWLKGVVVVGLDEDQEKRDGNGKRREKMKYGKFNWWE